jgi:hypothetical protein
MDLIKALALGIGQAFTGAVVGRAIEGLCNKLYPVGGSEAPDFTTNLLRVLIQLPVGLVALSTTMLIVSRGRFMQSVIGDTTLLFFFFIAQPTMIASVMGAIDEAYEDVKKKF